MDTKHSVLVHHCLTGAWQIPHNEHLHYNVNARWFRFELHATKTQITIPECKTM